MSAEQFYVLVAIPLVGILMQGGLFIYLGGRIDKVIDKVNDLDKRLSDVEKRLIRVEVKLGIEP